MENKPRKVDNGNAFEQAGMLHVVKEPETMGPYPTVVLLQGRMGNEEVMWVFANTLPENWLVVSVRALYPEGEGYSWYMDRSGWPTMVTYEDGISAVTHFIDQLPDLYDADPDQIHLMGFSQGAALSLAVAMKHPHKVQSIASLVGFVPEQCSAENQVNLHGLPIFFAIGARDETIPIYRARASRRFLEESLANVTSDEYTTGHRLNAQGMRDLKAWWDDRADNI